MPFDPKTSKIVRYDLALDGALAVSRLHREPGRIGRGHEGT